MTRARWIMRAVTGSATTRRRRLEGPKGLGASGSRAPRKGGREASGAPWSFTAGCSTRLGIPPHGPDRGTAEGELDLGHHLEAVAAVEGEVGVLGGLQVGGEAFGVAAFEDGGEKGGADALALVRLPGPEDSEIPVGLLRVLALHVIEGPDGPDGVTAQGAEHGREVAEDGARGEDGVARWRPEGGPGVVGGGPDRLEGQVVAPELDTEEPGDPSAPGLLVGEDPGHDGVVEE